MTFCENLPPMVPATSKVAVIGNAAHDDPNVGPPVKIGGGSRTLGQVPDAVQGFYADGYYEDAHQTVVNYVKLKLAL